MKYIPDQLKIAVTDPIETRSGDVHSVVASTKDDRPIVSITLDDPEVAKQFGQNLFRVVEEALTLEVIEQPIEVAELPQEKLIEMLNAEPQLEVVIDVVLLSAADVSAEELSKATSRTVRPARRYALSPDGRAFYSDELVFGAQRS